MAESPAHAYVLDVASTATVITVGQPAPIGLCISPSLFPQSQAEPCQQKTRLKPYQLSTGIVATRTT